MKAKILKNNSKQTGLKKDQLYQVTKMSDGREGVWVLDGFKNNTFLKIQDVELFQEDGITKYDASGINISFSGLLPKNVTYDPQTLTLTAIW